MKREREEKKYLSLLFKIYENRIVVFVEAKGKVGLPEESYAWVPKSRSFVKLREVENFSTRFTFSLKAV